MGWPTKGVRPAIGDEFLRLNGRHYDKLLTCLSAIRSDAPVTKLELIEVVAEYAWRHHPGRFADGAVENLGLEAAQHCGPGERRRGGLPAPRRDCSARGARHILHVASRVSNNGGLTRTLVNWIRTDQQSQHSLVLLHQPGLVMPPWLRLAIESSGGRVMDLPAESSLATKAAWLRELAAQDYHAVVLHVTSFESVHTAAFGMGGGPAVGLVNHADHAFWTGSAVTDLVIHQRHISQSICEHRRHTRNRIVLPIPLSDPTPGMTRRECRARLGIPDDQLVLLSVGRSCKYVPNATHDFFATANALLNEHPDAHLYVVGVSGREYFSRQPKSDRLHLVGFVEDTAPYRTAADIYLEGFPFGSQTALLEAGLAELPVVPAFGAAFEMAVANDESLWGVVTNPSDRDEYLARARELIRDKEYRRALGRFLRQRIHAAHVGDGWLERLAEVYAHLGRLRHDPQPIPQTTLQASEFDIALSAWQGALLGEGASDSTRANWVRNGLVGAAYSARRAGHYRDAWRLLRQSGRGWGGNSVTRRSLAKLPLCWLLGR